MDVFASHLLTAIDENAEPFKLGPLGKTAYSMKCSGMDRTLEQCYVKAGEVSPNEVLDSTIAIRWHTGLFELSEVNGVIKLNIH
jgi:hypothetical protein